MGRGIARFAGGLGLLAFLTCTSVAHADPSVDKATAEGLFDEARTLMKNGSYAAACPKLVESQRLDPGVGTLLYLGACYEKIDKLASAWATLREAAALAHNSGQADREKIAAGKADAIEPLVPRLSIDVAAPIDGLEVRVDGEPMGRASWGSALPLDPGHHVVEAKAPGAKSVSLDVELAKSDRKRLTVPRLEATGNAEGPPPPLAHPPPPPTPNEPPPRPFFTPMRIGGLAVGAVGVGGLVVGSIFGARAFSLASSVNDACPTGPCSAAVKADADDSRTAGTISTVAFAVGGVLLATGVVLWIAAPSTRAPVGLYVQPGLGSLVIGGQFR
jgi:serine/threonine-protein kinase